MLCANSYDRNNRHPLGCGYKNQARAGGLEYSKSAQAGFTLGDVSSTAAKTLISRRVENASNPHPQLRTPNSELRTHVGMLVVIDPSVADYQMLAAGVLPGAETIVLEPHRDAIGQITMALARHREHRAFSLHIICHGAPGKLYLGKTCLSAENLAPYRQQLLEWGVAEILLYSCEVAAGKVGTAFVEQLSRLTGADIAALAGLGMLFWSRCQAQSCLASG